jgi:peptidoglycan/LPS O-acetylase OafA/YrhL
MVSPGSYILSAALLAALTLSLAFSAYRIRQQLLPAWEGSPARLVEAVGGVALLIWLCELLGAVSLLYAGTLVVAAAALAAAIALGPRVLSRGKARWPKECRRGCRG